MVHSQYPEIRRLRLVCGLEKFLVKHPLARRILLAFLASKSNLVTTTPGSSNFVPWRMFGCIVALPETLARGPRLSDIGAIKSNSSNRMLLGPEKTSEQRAHCAIKFRTLGPKTAYYLQPSVHLQHQHNRRRCWKRVSGIEELSKYL